MKRPYSPPRLTKYSSVSELPDNLRQAIVKSMDIAADKIFIPPSGELHGLQCARCGRDFYADTAKAVNEAFDNHRCEG